MRLLLREQDVRINDINIKEQAIKKYKLFFIFSSPDLIFSSRAKPLFMIGSVKTRPSNCLILRRLSFIS
jgi:hypothetical protein